MRKIKELEERIDRLERLERCNIEIRSSNEDLFGKELDNIKVKQNEIESKQKEQEEFLKKTVAPFIANSLKEELDKSLTELTDALAELFKVEPKKKEVAKTKTTKTKKESK